MGTGRDNRLRGTERGNDPDEFDEKRFNEEKVHEATTCCDDLC